LRATHSYKFHPGAQAKTADVVRVTVGENKSQIVVRHRGGSAKPKTSSVVVRAAGYASAVTAVDSATQSRPDLRSSALQHYTALQKAQRVKPSKAA
jgi:hypothetical protein